jgi:predicted HTH transcriptional regulator
MLLIFSDVYSILLVVGVGFVISLLIAFLFRGYLFNLRQQVMAADMLTDIVSSFNKSIEQKEKRIIDLMMRVELLELKLGAGQSFVPVNTSVVSNSVMSSDVSVDINDITLSETELKVIKFLSDSPKRLFDVRQEIGKTREHTSRVVSSLVKKGIVEKRTKDGQVLCQVRDHVLDKLDF